MQVQLELYASLMKYLPAEAKRHRLRVDLEPGTTVQALLDRYALPPELTHLVLCNGVFMHPEERGRALEPDDVIAVWPPVAGG